VYQTIFNYRIAENPTMVAHADVGQPYHDEQHKQRDIIRRLFQLLTRISLKDPDTWIKTKIINLDRFERTIVLCEMLRGALTWADPPP